MLHDVHERLAPIDAVALAKALEPYRLFLLEDVLAPEDLDWLRTLRAQTATPIAIGELFTNPAEYLPLIRDRLCDFIPVHVSAVGGITPTWRLACAADLFGVRTAWHGPDDVSPVGHAANLALHIACPTFGIQEQHAFSDAAWEVFPGCPVVKDGRLWPSDTPGLGVDLDERAAAAFPPVAHSPVTPGPTLDGPTAAFNVLDPPPSREGMPLMTRGELSGRAVPGGLAGAGTVAGLGVVTGTTAAASGPKFDSTAQFRMGVGTHMTGPRCFPDAVKVIAEMGANAIRDEIGWSGVEQQKGIYQIPAAGDRYVRDAAAHGLDPLLILDYGNPLYGGAERPTSPESIAAFTRYAEFVARHFARVVSTYEVWNEWNIAIGGVHGSGDPAAYVRLLTSVHQALKAVDPSLTVVAGAVSGYNTDYIDGLLGNGVLSHCDVFSDHPYIYGDVPLTQREPEVWLQNMKDLRSRLQQHNGGQDFPIFITEIGWPTQIDQRGISQDLEAAYCARLYLLARTLPSLRGLWWYDFQDDGWQYDYNENNFGLVRADLTPKKGFHAYRSASALVRSGSYGGRLDAGDANVWALRFSQPGAGDVLAMWNSYPDNDWSVVLRIEQTGHEAVTRHWGRLPWYDNNPSLIEDEIDLTLRRAPVLMTGAIRGTRVTSVIERKFPEAQRSTGPCMSGPDMVVTGLSWAPSAPKVGDHVMFTATVNNQGSEPTPDGVVTGVAFAVAGNEASWSDTYLFDKHHIRRERDYDRQQRPVRSSVLEPHSGWQLPSHRHGQRHIPVSGERRARQRSHGAPHRHNLGGPMSTDEPGMPWDITGTQVAQRSGYFSRRKFLWYGGSISALAYASASGIAPTRALAADAGTGLKAEYYNNMDLTDLLFVRVDPTVDFVWADGSSPDPRIDPGTFSIRWYGKVQPQYSETYTFYTTTDDGVRLWVDDQQLVDEWVDQGPTEWTGQVALTAGQQYDIIMEYYQNGGGGSAKLEWSSSSQPRQVIPHASLYPLPVASLEKLVITGLALSEQTGLYVLASTAEPAIDVGLYNRLPQATDATVRWTLLARGRQQVGTGTATAHVDSGAQQQITVPTTKLTDGDYYMLQIDVLDGDGRLSDSDELGLGVIYPAHTGLRPNSPFALGFRTEGDQSVHYEIAQKIGVKWSRGTGDAVDPNIVNPSPGVFWGQQQIDAARQQIQRWLAAGVHTTGFINYNMAWNVEPGPNGETLQPYQNRPKDLHAQAEMVYRTIRPLRDLVNTWEIWNEPWVHDWTWATGTGQDYRDMSRYIWDLVKPDYPEVNLIGGGSVPYNRDIEYALNEPNRGYIDGSVNHAYGNPTPTQFGMVKLQVAMDRLWSQTKGRAGQWQTELGTGEFMYTNLPAGERPYQVARTLAPTYLLHMLAADDSPIHIFWFSLSYGAGYSGDEFNMYDLTNNTPKPVVVAYAAMTHFLEDTELVGGLYPQAKSTWGFLFKRGDGNGTAAIYAEQGMQGTLQLDDARGLSVYDYLGRPVAVGKSGPVVLDLKPLEMLYLVSNQSVDRLQRTLKNARYAFTTPLTIAPLSFTRPISGPATIEIHLENTSPSPVSVKLAVNAPPSWKLAQDSQRLTLSPGEQRTIPFPASQSAANADNRYPVGYVATLYDGQSVVGRQAGQQDVQVAYAPRRTITIDGRLDDWDGVIPVTMKASDGTTYTAWTAWDNDRFYFAAQVPDQTHNSNKPYAQDKFAITVNADCVQLAFNLIDRNTPDDFLLGDPYYEKAGAADMDHLFVAALAQGNVAELHRECAPGTNYQEEFYPTCVDGVKPPLGPMKVPGAEGDIAIVRDDTKKITTYEIAMDWSNLKPLAEALREANGANVVESRFGWAVNDAGGSGIAYWTAEAALLEYGTYNFSPFWSTGDKAEGGRILTRWGFGH